MKLLKKITLILSMFVFAVQVLPVHATGGVQNGLIETSKVQQIYSGSSTTRKGGWLDEIDASVVDTGSAITQLHSGTIDIYSYGLAASQLPDITSAGLSYSESKSIMYEIMYNPATFTDTDTLNPFTDKKIREATNYLYDRNYINQEVYAGASLLKYFALTTGFPDYNRLGGVATALEAQYAYNPDKAMSIITTEMGILGATLGAGGKWQFKGNPVVLKFLIRNDGDGTRLPMGDYVADQLEWVGFTVDRQYKKSSEAAPIWQGDPTTGAWNMYTAAWGNSGFMREEWAFFQNFYAADSAYIRKILQIARFISRPIPGIF